MPMETNPTEAGGNERKKELRKKERQKEKNRWNYRRLETKQEKAPFSDWLLFDKEEEKMLRFIELP